MKQINCTIYKIFSKRNFSGEYQWHYVYANITNFCKWMKNFRIQIPHKTFANFHAFYQNINYPIYKE